MLGHALHVMVSQSWDCVLRFGHGIAALVTAALGMASFSMCGLYCNHADLSPRYAPFLLGMTNTVGALPGIVGELSYRTALAEPVLGQAAPPDRLDQQLCILGLLVLRCHVAMLPNTQQWSAAWHLSMHLAPLDGVSCLFRHTCK